MRRLTSLMLSVAFVPTVVIAGPVVSRPAPAPHPVATATQDLTVDPVLVAAAVSDGPRPVAATGQRTTRPFEALGVTWAADRAVGDLDVMVRTRTHGRWTEWVDLDEEAAEDELTTAPAPGTRMGTAPIWVGASDGVQVRVEALSGRAPADVRVALIDPGSSDADAAVAPTLGGSLATAATPQPTIRSRAAWGADESIRRGSPSYATTISAVALHHSASSNDYAPGDVPRILRGFYAFHVQSRGWSDIGYNMLVDKYGTAWEGRAGGLDRPVIGSHAGGFNTGTSGISMIGTFEHAPPPALFETVARLAAWKLSLHGRDPKSSVTLTSKGSTRYASGTNVTLPRIFGHRDVSTTGCPGNAGFASLPVLRQRAAEIIAAEGGGAPPPPPPPPPPSSDPFGELESAAPEGNGARVTGWAIDADASSFTRVAVSVDGAHAGTLVADVHRPDVAAENPPYSPNHGFDGVVPATAGTRQVCAVGINQNGGVDRSLGCRTVQIGSAEPAPAPTPTPSPTPTPTPSKHPEGALDAVAPETEAVHVRGWAVDPDAHDFTRVAVSVGGAAPTVVVADVESAYVRSTYPQYSPRHGFDARVSAPAGTHDVCVTALNQNDGHDVALGCRSVTVAAAPPPPPPAPVPPTRAIDDSCPDGRVPAGSFTDLAGSVHAPAIRCMVWWEVASGRSSTSYEPARPVTRAQMASFLARALKESGGWLPPSPSDAFRDDAGTGGHQLAINQLAAVGIAKGKGDGTFDPYGVVTREQMASFLVATFHRRTGRVLPAGENYFSDDDGSTHEASIGAVAAAGFTGGATGGGFAPRVATDRGQMATFLARLLDLLVEAGDAPAHR